MYVFGKTIETTKGTFRAGDALPSEWTGKETIRQLKEKFGEDTVLLPQQTGQSMATVVNDIAEIKAAIVEIRDALGVGEKKKKLNA